MCKQNIPERTSKRKLMQKSVTLRNRVFETSDQNGKESNFEWAATLLSRRSCRSGRYGYIAERHFRNDKRICVQKQMTSQLPDTRSDLAGRTDNRLFLVSARLAFSKDKSW